jgi:hypothetical protein
MTTSTITHPRTLATIERIHDALATLPAPERSATECDHPAAFMLLAAVIAGTASVEVFGDRCWAALDALAAATGALEVNDEDNDSLSAPSWCPEHGPVTWACCPED